MKGETFNKQKRKVMNKVLAMLVLILGLSACSYRTEIGWHGMTGRDDRTQTELVSDREVRKAKY